MAAHDRAEGGSGDDTLTGGAGDKFLVDAKGKGSINHSRKATAKAAKETGNDSLDGGEGDDVLVGGVATKSSRVGTHRPQLLQTATFR
ncbi:MAG: hypothetical protein QNJ16_08210 [Rhodobacter sp.]|nr:hypothetical protein [Rhodobacter sp.]